MTKSLTPIEYAARRAAGKCVLPSCKLDAREGKTRCARHAQQDTLAMQKTRSERKALGMCTSRGCPNLRGETLRCEACRLRHKTSNNARAPERQAAEEARRPLVRVDWRALG